MAFQGFSGPKMAGVGSPFQVDTTPLVPVGTMATDTEGNEYIYLKGVASVVAGDWVTYSGAYQAARLAGNAIGPVAVFLAAVVADRWGWAARKGQIAGTNSDTISAASKLYIDGTAGRVDEDVVAGDLVANAYAIAADVSNKVTVNIHYPFVTDTLS